MKKYTPPKKEFFMLPNKIFDMPLDVYTFKIYVTTAAQKEAAQAMGNVLSM